MHVRGKWERRVYLKYLQSSFYGSLITRVEESHTDYYVWIMKWWWCIYFLVEKAGKFCEFANREREKI